MGCWCLHNLAAQIAKDSNTGLWGSTWEELFRGDALGEGGIRQGLACQAQLFPLHAVHSLEVAPCCLHVLHTQLTPSAAVTSAIACAHCNCCLGFCSEQVLPDLYKGRNFLVILFCDCYA